MSPGSERGSRRIVVVDDDPVSRLVLARLLRRQGHQVFDAGDLTSGLALATSVEPDLVFSDYFLPDGTGDDLLVAIRAAGGTVPFVLVTGVAELNLTRINQAGGDSDKPRAAAVMTKPVDSRAVAGCLASVLGPSPAR